MANPEHVEIVKQGRDAVLAWRKENSDKRLDLFGADLNGVNLNRADLSGADLSGADLHGSSLFGADLEKANLSDANLRHAGLSDANLTGARLNNANLNMARLNRANLSRSYLSDANLAGARLKSADLTHARLVDVDLSHARLSDANLAEAHLNQANLNLAILNRADLRGANLSGANLIDAGLIGVNLISANLIAARLRGANLKGSNLSNANLRVADLSGADLSDANLTDTDLRFAKLIRTSLLGVDLKSARLGWTTFGHVDLSSARNLQSVRHESPSEIGIDTLFKSQGKIPEAFLRGCGVPDGLITYLPALLKATEAIQFYSCFISHSHKDEEFCKRLHSRMRDEHLRVWFAPEDIKGGEKIHEQIEQAIRVYDKLLLVLSEESMKSEWVKTEIRHARQREVQEGRRILFPIRLVSFETIRDWKAFDADTGKDMAVEIREYFIPDFSNWKDHDAFESAFSRLLQDLKASTE